MSTEHQDHSEPEPTEPNWSFETDSPYIDPAPNRVESTQKDHNKLARLRTELKVLQTKIYGAASNPNPKETFQRSYFGLTGKLYKPFIDWLDKEIEKGNDFLKKPVQDLAYTDETIERDLIKIQKILVRPFIIAGSIYVKFVRNLLNIPREDKDLEQTKN